MSSFTLSAFADEINSDLKIQITEEFEPHLELFKHTLEISRIMECIY